MKDVRNNDLSPVAKSVSIEEVQVGVSSPRKQDGILRAYCCSSDNGRCIGEGTSVSCSTVGSPQVKNPKELIKPNWRDILKVSQYLRLGLNVRLGRSKASDIFQCLALQLPGKLK